MSDIARVKIVSSYFPFVINADGKRYRCSSWASLENDGEKKGRIDASSGLEPSSAIGWSLLDPVTARIARPYIDCCGLAGLLIDAKRTADAYPNRRVSGVRAGPSACADRTGLSV